MPTSVSTVGSNFSKTSGTTLDLSAGNIAPGTVLVLSYVTDSVSGTPTFSVNNVGGGTWVQRYNVPVNAGSAGGGIYHVVWTCEVVTAITSTVTVTVTSSIAAVARAAYMVQVIGARHVLRGSAVAGVGVSATTSANPEPGDVVIGTVGTENNTVAGDTDTTNGSWGTLFANGTTGGGAASNVYVGVSGKVVTATGPQSFDPTSTGGDTATGIFTLVARPRSDLWDSPTLGSKAAFPEAGGRQNGFGGVFGDYWIMSGGRILNDYDTTVTLRYNFLTDTWDTRASAPDAREFPASAVINGKLYAWAGWSTRPAAQGGSTYPTSVLVYDPATDSWTTKNGNGQQRLGAAGGTDGRYLYAFCGQNQLSQLTGDVYRYDPVADSWATLTSPTNLINQAVALYYNGKFYLMGSAQGTNGTLNIYDVASDTWSTGASAPTSPNAVSSSGAWQLVTGRYMVYVSGAGTLIYDPANNAWEARDDRPAPARNGSFSAVWDNRVWITTGASTLNSSLKPLDTEVYSAFAPNFSGRSAATATGAIQVGTPPPDPTTAPTVTIGVEQVTVGIPALVGDADSYNLYRDSTMIANVAASSNYIDTAASCVATQTYKLKSVKLGTESTNFGPTSSPVVADPSAPAFTATGLNGAVRIDITKKSYDAVYKVYKAVTGGTRTLVHTSATQTGAGTYSWTDTAVTNATAYDYTVTTTVATPTSRTSTESAVATSTPSAFEKHSSPPGTTSRSHSAVAVVNAKMYWIGGNIVYYGGSPVTYDSKNWCYDPATDTWTEKAPFPYGAAEIIAYAAYGNYIYTFCYEWGNSTQVATTTYRYDTVGNTWTTLTSAPWPGTVTVGDIVDNGGFAVLYNNKIYCWAKVNSGTASDNRGYIFDPATETWNTASPLANAPTATTLRFDSNHQLVGDKIYVFESARIAIYNITTDAWSEIPVDGLTLNFTPGGGRPMGVLNGKVIMAGVSNYNGSWTVGTHDKVYSWDPTTNSAAASSFTVIDGGAPDRPQVAPDASLILTSPVTGKPTMYFWGGTRYSPAANFNDFYVYEVPDVNKTGTAAVSGSGTLTAAGTPNPVASPALSGSGAVTVSASPALAPSTSVTGSGATSASVTLVTQTASDVSGDGGLGLSAAATIPVTTDMTGGGALVATGAASVSLEVTIAGVGLLSVEGQNAYAGEAAYTGGGALLGSGTVATATNLDATGAGGLSATGTPIAAASVAVGGDGTLSPAESPAPTATTDYSGSGALTAEPVAVTITATAPLTGTGSTVASGRPDVQQQAYLTSSGAVTSVAVPTPTGTADFMASGTLAGVDANTRTGEAFFSGSGRLQGPLDHRDVTVLIGTTRVGSTVENSRTGSVTPGGTRSGSVLVATVTRQGWTIAQSRRSDTVSVDASRTGSVDVDTNTRPGWAVGPTRKNRET